MTSAIEKGIPSEGEMTYDTQDRWSQWHGTWLVKAVPLKDEKGLIIGAIETAFQISKKAAAEKRRLEEKETQFKIIAESAINAIIILDDKGRITYWNPASERIF